MQKTLSRFLFLSFILLFVNISIYSQEFLSNYSNIETKGRSKIILTDKGHSLRITPYGNHIIRIQAVRREEDFFEDNRNEMVDSHQWEGQLSVDDNGELLSLTTGEPDGIKIILQKNPVRLSFSQSNSKEFLKDAHGVTWTDDSVYTAFVFDSSEHFAGLGHGYLGRVSKLDLKGEFIKRNYGTEHYQQAPLLVPFYLSNKGYGIFLNSTFQNSFSFGNDGYYGFSIAPDAQLDYFVIAGPEFEKILDRYTQLTGRPRLPPKAVFGLALSDKGNDHNSPDPSDENWWKRKIKEHRDAGFPIDHIVNDNRWRAGGGQRCESYLDWDPVRYPDPKEYNDWVTKNGLIVTLDFNRCIASRSEGWKSEFNIPESDSIAFNESAPDLTRKEVRNWFWGIFWRKSLNPDLNYPGDALWIDEFDEMGKADTAMILGNGRTWGEMKNYWFFLIAQALVRDGWDKSFNGSKRPFVWVRGMTAGAQRYATLWSGDIVPKYDEMETQVRGMQAAGLSGFPFWGHDAGGFFNYELNDGPDDIMYRQWSLAFGSFTPYWKPHGPGYSRWPLDRSSEAQADAKKYSTLRYQLMPYLYTYAHIASEKGVPVARPMLLEYQAEPLAWSNDLQYMWGEEFLVAPNCSDGDEVKVWLPEGNWYDYWNDSLLTGNRAILYSAPVGVLPLFVKEGSIIPMSDYALSTAFIPDDTLTLHVYTGKDAVFTLYEDDGVTEAYNKGENRITKINYNQKDISLTINQVKGNYLNAPVRRVYRIIYHGLKESACFKVNGANVYTQDINWNTENNTLTIDIVSYPVNEDVKVMLCKQ